MICYLRYCVLFLLSALLSISPLMQVVSHADVNDLMIATDSNALMTLNLDESDYAVMPLSSVGTVSNTITDSAVIISYTNGQFVNNAVITPSLVNNRFDFSWSMPDYMQGYWITDVFFVLQSKTEGVYGLPSPSGNYDFSMDFSSDFSYDLYNGLFWSSCYKYDNSIYDVTSYKFSTSMFTSGDFYIPPTAFNIRSGYWYNRIQVSIPQSDLLQNFGGSYAVRFTPSDSEGISLSGNSVSSDSMYEDGVTGSLSDISSSVESVEEEISLVTQAIQTLQGAMEPHYDNVLTQLHHITEQLHAFYDQVYNNIHLPELAKMDEIIDAISNIDIEFQIDFDELKTSINNMSTTLQNKLQSTADQITGGFDNAQQATQNEQLSGAIDEYDQIESDVFEDATGFMGELEYSDLDSMPMGIIKALAFIGAFLQSIFICMGDFSVIITFSLTMIFVMIVIGYHRIRS